MLNLIQIEQTKVLKRNLYWILFGLITAFTLLFGSDLWFNSEVPVADRMWPNQLDAGLEVAFGVGSFLVILLIGATVGQSYTWRMTQQALARGTARWQLLIASFLGFFAPILMLLTWPIILSLANSVMFTVYHGGSIDLAAMDGSLLMKGILASFLTAQVYGALTLLSAYATRSTVAAIGSGVFFLFILEQIFVAAGDRFGGLVATIAERLPSQLTSALIEQIVAAHSGEAVTDGLISASNATMGLLVYVAGSLAFAFMALRRQDLTG